MSDAYCRRCASRINRNATRCPECGYDPSPGPLALLALVVAAPFAALGLLVGVTTLLGVVTLQLSVVDAVGVFVATSILFGPAVGVVAWVLQKRGRTAGRRR
jgi:hypothetical protein